MVREVVHGNIHGLPPEQIHLVTVPQSGAPRDLLWQRYCEAFGIDPVWAPAESSRENVSIGTAETALVRKLNRRLRKAGLPGEDYRRLVRQLVVHETLAQRTDMTRATLPPSAYPWVEEIAQEWVDWVEGSGIHVIGDVADLRPVRPPEDVVWRDPDKPRRRDMVDAALDAMVALTLEAASRPDPDDQLSAKLGRPKAHIGLERPRSDLTQNLGGAHEGRNGERTELVVHVTPQLVRG